MGEFYLFEQDRQRTDLPMIETYPDELDIMDFISGKKLERSDSPIEMTLAVSSGAGTPDLFTYLFPMFSHKMIQALSDFGVDNIDYYPVNITNPHKGTELSGYSLANVHGLIECVDVENSDAKVTEFLGEKMYKLKSFVIDDERTADIPLFRLAEKGQFLIISEALKKHLEKYKFEGIRILNTKEYPGY